MNLLFALLLAIATPITHVIIIVQENRSVDNLFNGLAGADTVTVGKNSLNKSVTLQPISLTAPYDISHRHNAFEVEYHNNGFDLVASSCKPKATCPNANVRAYGYVPRSEAQPYFDMATQYAFADRMFQTNQGPSFPAHQYLVSGTSTTVQNGPLRAAENPRLGSGALSGGCDSPPKALVSLIDSAGDESQKTYPCFERPTLTDLLDAKGITWRYYQSHTGAGLWNGLDAVKHVWSSPEYKTNVVVPGSAILKDIGAGKLAQVSWVTPFPANSDHAGTNDGSGPSWVTAIVNTIGQSKYWNSTVILLTWDDWGGWYDHVVPPSYNSYELGFRVPLVLISPYAKHGYVSHVQHEFGSILKFIETNYGLGSLGTTDTRSDDLGDMLDYSQQPSIFAPISAPKPASDFIDLRPSYELPDN